MAQDAITIRNVSKSFGKFEALKKVSFSVGEGEVCGLLGSNGAGKSTLINLLSFLSTPTEGEIKVFGKADSKMIGLAPQENSFYEELTVWENLGFFGRLYGLEKKRIDEEAVSILALLGLSEKKSTPGKNLSGGMKRRLNLACALMHNPKLVILDEPSVGLDPVSRRLLWETILRLKAKGMTVLITTHYMDEADHLCDRIVLLNKGEMVLEGTPRQLKKQGLSSIELELSSKISKTALKKIRSIASVKECNESNNALSVKTSEPERALPLLMKQLGKSVKRVEVRNPTLEDFFMSLEDGKK